MASTNPAAAADVPVHVKIALNGRDENRKFKLSLKDCSPNVLPDKLRGLLQVPPNQDTVFERYSDSSASFVTLDSSHAAVYKQLFRAAKAKGKLRLRVTFIDKAAPEPELSQTTPSLPDRLTSRKYVHPFVSDLSNKENIPSARLSTLVDLKTASEVPSTTTLAPSNEDQVEDQPSRPMTEPKPYYWPITEDPSWSESAKSIFQKEPTKETQDALRTVNGAIANRHATEVNMLTRFLESQASAFGKRTHDSEAPVPRQFTAREQCRAEMSGFLKEPAAPQCSFALRPKPSANFTICCNNCDGAIPDAHWHCSICDDGDFDLCQDCVERGYLCDNEEHWLIKRSLEDGKVVTSKTETIAPKTANKVTEPTVEKEVPGAFISRVKAEQPQMAAHLSRTCNQCVQVFDESQFVTCTACDDYDLCTPCHVNMKHGHHPNHGFAPASGATVLSQIGTQLLPPGRNQRHWAICDGCEKDIYGIRHKCLDCPDWDYCSDCKKNAPKTHPDHTLVPLYEHFSGVSRNLQKHVGVYCDGELCADKNSYITGDRYKCTVCDDTDFCASCEALPRSAHNRTHPLLKLKTPVRNVTVSTFGSKTDGSPMHVMGDQHPQTSSKATETNAPAPSANAATQVQTIAEVKPVEHTVGEKSKKAANPPKPADIAGEANAYFVKDIIPDGTIMAPGSQFTQAWTLSNPGPHSWPVGCSVCFIGGDGMLDVDPNHPSHITQIRKAIKTNTIEYEVKPGESADFKVAMRAPEREGKAISYWRLKMADSTPFGHKLWCDINVKKPVQSEAATTKHIEDIAAHQPKVEDEVDAVAKEANPATTSKMIFPKLDKESPVSSITQDGPSSEPETVAAPVPAPVDDLLDVESLELDDDDDDADSSDEGFLTDEEYELVASGDEMEEAKNGRK